MQTKSSGASSSSRRTAPEPVESRIAPLSLRGLLETGVRVGGQPGGVISPGSRLIGGQIVEEALPVVILGIERILGDGALATVDLPQEICLEIVQPRAAYFFWTPRIDDQQTSKAVEESPVQLDGGHDFTGQLPSIGEHDLIGDGRDGGGGAGVGLWRRFALRRPIRTPIAARRRGGPGRRNPPGLIALACLLVAAACAASMPCLRRSTMSVASHLASSARAATSFAKRARPSAASRSAMQSASSLRRSRALGSAGVVTRVSNGFPFSTGGYPYRLECG